MKGARQKLRRDDYARRRAIKQNEMNPLCRFEQGHRGSRYFCISFCSDEKQIQNP